jgi:hypothetical protein
VADLPALLTLHHEDGTNSRVPIAEVEPFAFHRSVVAHLERQTPMEVTALQSRDVVALMEAAEKSALANGMPVTPSLLRG